MSFGKLLLIFLVLVSWSACLNAVVFYEDSGHKGRSYTAPGDWADNRKCNNMDGFNDVVSSIDTKGKCVIVYEHGECNGEERRVYPGSRCHGHLTEIQMNDRISSYRSCQTESCPAQ